MTKSSTPSGPPTGRTHWDGRMRARSDLKKSVWPIRRLFGQTCVHSASEIRCNNNPMTSHTINERGMSRKIDDSPWLDHDQANSLASIRLFCFPYVGGGSWIYRGWSDYAGKEIEIIPLALPGRDKRLWEQPYSSLSPLLGALAEVLPKDNPFGCFAPELVHRKAHAGASLGTCCPMPISGWNSAFWGELRRRCFKIPE